MDQIEIQKIHDLIQLLTDDEDLRQELWLKYLSGCPQNCLPDALCDLIREEINNNNLNYQISNDIRDLKCIHNLIEDLPRHQQNIIVLLYTGFTVELISQYKGISVVRIKQSIYSFYYQKVKNTSKKEAILWL